MMQRMEKLKRLGLSILEYLGVLRVVLDISSDEVRLLEAIRLPLFYKVLRYKKESFSDTDRMAFFLERFLEKNSTHPIRRLELTLSGTSVIPLFLTFPGIPRDKIPSVVSWEIEKHVPVKLDEAYYTYKVMARFSGKGMDTWNVLVVCAKKEELNRFYACFEQLGIKVMKTAFLPLHLLDPLKAEKSHNGQGLVAVFNNAIYLYVLLNNKVIHFARYDGNFSTLNGITLKNISIFFSDFIKSDFMKRENLFLEKIMVMGDLDRDTEGLLMNSLSDSLNIITLSVDEHNYKRYFSVRSVPVSDFDIYGYGYTALSPVKTIFPMLRRQAWTDRAVRFLMVALITLDLTTLIALIPMAAAFSYYSRIQKVRNTPAEQLNDAESRKILKDLADIAVIETFEQKQKEMEKKTAAAKLGGSSSSQIRLVLADISRAIPDDVWLSDITINKSWGEIKGSALSSDGLSAFTKKLNSSAKRINTVLLKKADSFTSGNKTMISFTISFGVNL